MDIPSFATAVEEGEILSKDGYHKPGTTASPRWKKCGCTKTTSEGAYRDVSVRVGDMVVHYYYQSPVVVSGPDTLRLSSCGWQTATTKDRINKHIPKGFRVFQDDFEWYVEKPNGDIEEFRDGMEITNFSILIKK